MLIHARPEIVQTAIVKNQDGRVLILRTPHGKWQLPGGRLIAGEHWEDGLKREVFEETGIDDLEIRSLLMVNNWDWDGLPQYGVYFHCTTNTTDVRLSAEHDRFEWVGGGDDLSKYDFWHVTLQELVERVLIQRG